MTRIEDIERSIKKLQQQAESGQFTPADVRDIQFVIEEHKKTIKKLKEIQRKREEAQ